MATATKRSLENKHLGNGDYLRIRPVARMGYGSIAHESRPNGILGSLRNDDGDGNNNATKQ